jgi:hypothetical protein
MPNQYQTVSLAKQREIAKLSARGLSIRTIGQRLKIDHTVVLRYKDRAPAAPLTAEQLEEGIRTALRRAHAGEKDLAKGLGVTLTRLRGAVEGMQARGVMIVQRPGGILDMAPVAALEPGRHEIKTKPYEEQVYGITTDNHLCSKYSRLDVLNAAYDHFERRGITHVFNAGNMIDGEARFNKTELLTAPGMDNQIDYLIDKWPVRKGITTHFIAGDDHEGWYTQREGIEIGRYMETRAIADGRNDLHYLGYAEADVALRCGSGSAVCRVVHPGGGSAYAISYTSQKLVESYQGGEKPHILLVGHYHKAEYCFPREVHCLQAACTSDQSLFMRKKKLAAHVGFWEFRVTQDEHGAVNHFGQDFFHFFDRGYYERRYK